MRAGRTGKGVREMKPLQSDAERQALLKSLMEQLSPADEQKLKQILADKDAQKKMLSTPQAQELLRKLFGK